MTLSRQNGFTLLEIMVALVIFSLLSFMGHQILQGVMRNNEITQQHASRLGDTARLFALLEQDLSQALIPSVPGSDDNHHGLVMTTTEAGMRLQFTRRNWLNPTQAARSSLQNVAWHFVQSRLTRTNLNEDRITARFDGIHTVRLRFLQNGHWQRHWKDPLSLPEAVEITIDISTLGEIQRVMMISGGQP